ncbi:MAG: diacylglycerol kinase [Deltaproteobacteria bacterium]|nr:diacylglycerol kinase [Deltaproteobacteria bacterium]
MGDIGVIVNPRSRQMRRDPGRLNRLAQVLGETGRVVATQSVDEVADRLREFRNEGMSILAIHGGDGTIHATLSVLLGMGTSEPLPTILFLPGGTLNTITTGLGVRGDPEALLGAVAEKVRRGEPLPEVERNVLQLEGRSGFIFGNGAVASFLEAYYATGHPSRTTAALLLARTVCSVLVGGRFSREILDPFQGRVVVDGNPWPPRALVTVTAATVPEIGLGFTPYYRYNERPDHFALLGIYAGPLALASELGRIWRGLPMRPGKCFSAVAKEVRIESDKPFSYVIDGELYKADRELTLRIGPRLRYIGPFRGSVLS